MIIPLVPPVAAKAAVGGGPTFVQVTVPSSVVPPTTVLNVTELPDVPPVVTTSRF
jgi:hypothetical protein